MGLVLEFFSFGLVSWGSDGSFFMGVLDTGVGVIVLGGL